MINIKTRTVCFTGHRSLPAEELPEISRHLEDTLIALIEQGYCYFGAGGALGGWPQDSIDIYEDIKRHADKVIYSAENYFRGCMQKRNRHLVDSSSVCICYLITPTGGTAYTVNYARRMGLRVINIAESINL